MLSYLKNFVELRTKVASVFPFVYTLVIYILLYKESYDFNVLIVVLFAIAILCLDMATTALNHLAGIKDEINISMYDQKLIKDMDDLGLSMKFNYSVFFILVTLGIGLGIIITLLSNIYVLGIGAVCVFVAIIYSYGPLPLKNTFLGELASGITMGMLIPLALIFALDASIFINIKDLILNINLENVLIWFFVLMIPSLVIANIMLANNICDVEKDVADGRLTLPIVIGKSKSIFLWKLLYIIVYIVLIGLVATNIFPLITLFSLVTIPFVYRNCRAFVKLPVKSKSFKFAVQNLVLIMSIITITLVIEILIKI